jgi:uncharacterized low-complexity protein
MKKKKRNLIVSAVAAASVAALGNIQANNHSIEVNTLGTGAEVRSGLLTNHSIAKMLNDLKCGENKTDTKTDKSKGKEGKCGEGKCGEKKTKEQPK